jgi:hypothetical protein
MLMRDVERTASNDVHHASGLGISRRVYDVALILPQDSRVELVDGYRNDFMSMPSLTTRPAQPADP